MTSELNDGEWTTLPAEVRALDRFLPWVIRPRSSGRVGKVPARRLGRSLYPVRADDPAAWLSFDEARAEVLQGQAGGIGLCLPHDLCVVDVDDVLHGGILEPAVQALVHRAGTWCEVSPSGRGVHLWFRVPEGLSLSPGRSEGLELLTQRQFVTLTGISYDDSRTVQHCSPDLIARFSRRPREVQPLPSTTHSQRLPDDVDALLQEVSRHSVHFRRLFVDGDIGSHASASEADLALCQWLHRLLGPDPELIDACFRRSALAREKWCSESYRDRTIALALRSGWWDRSDKET